MNSVGLSNCASSEILGVEGAFVVTKEAVATLTAVVEGSDMDPPCPCTPPLFELRSCFRRAFCGFVSLEIDDGPFSSTSLTAWSAEPFAADDDTDADEVATFSMSAKVEVGVEEDMLELPAAAAGCDWLSLC